VTLFVCTFRHSRASISL